MTTNTNEPEPAADAGGLAAALHGINWPGAVAFGALVLLFIVGPRLGVNPAEAAAGIGAVLAAYGLHHAKRANRQTNGALDERMTAAVERGADALRAELPALIRQALDTSPTRDPWAGNEEPTEPLPAPGAHRYGEG